ncbi:hypothetical protein [Neoaquamicrobium sediminum]|uniref:hypothetical protein n=1 Tax=Neoaquamicrobium sediminum TaxID=1849104 RepID=UPI00361C8B37
MFRACVDQLRFQRRGEIEALNRKLSRQEQSILVVRAKAISNGTTAKADVHAAV